ncbi:DMT family transporter [Sneathiella chinensis]|uniref:DMT family transporter n=1 Tax=Sneathiella chinensis TaxID=349750 RepID=UPI00146CB57E|nr:SMR family transporter [Sneathiella chinensis]
MHWVYLMLAVVGEVIGTTAMKALMVDGHQVIGTLIALGTVGLAYALMSRATLRIPVALANAFWEGFGMILIALISFWVLDEYIAPLQAAAIVLAVVGIVIVNYGHYQQEAGE